MRRWTRVLVAVGLAVVVAVLVHDGHAQATGDGPTSVVMTSPQPNNGWGTIGDVSWPAAAYAVVNRFLTVLERMVTDTRAWLDRALDLTKGRLKVDYRKTVVNAWPDTDPDRTGPIPQHQRRRTDPGRNGTAPHDEDEPTPQ